MEEKFENVNEQNVLVNPGEAEAVSEQKEGKTKNADTDEMQALPAGPNGWLEGIYEHFRIVPLKALDCFIVICVIALITVITVGILRAKGLL